MEQQKKKKKNDVSSYFTLILFPLGSSELAAEPCRAAGGAGPKTEGRAFKQKQVRSDLLSKDVKQSNTGEQNNQARNGIGRMEVLLSLSSDVWISSFLLLVLLQIKAASSGRSRKAT